MTALSATQIKKPQDWQAFERASAVLWRCILEDDALTRFGRSGQAQHGLDLTGYRKSDPKKFVGVQCKCIGQDGELDEATIRSDLSKAAGYDPPIVEYVITTTAENDKNLDQLAHKLTKEFSDSGRQLIVRVWGWGTLEERIREHSEAINAFDPHHSPLIESLKDELKLEFRESKETITHEIRSMSESVIASMSQFQSSMVASGTIPYEDGHGPDKSHNEELDRYRNLLNSGKPKTALHLIEEKEKSLEKGVSASIRCRLKLLAGHCQWHLGNEIEAAKLFTDAAAIAPDDKRGKSGSVLAAIIANENQRAIDLAMAALAEDATNEGVAPWILMAAAKLPVISDPISLIPIELREKQSVVEAHVDYLRAVSRHSEWWLAAREGYKRFPDSFLLGVANADSEFDEFIQTTAYSQTGRISAEWRERLQSVATALERFLDDGLSSENPARSDVAGIACNLVSMLGTLDERVRAVTTIKKVLVHNPTHHELLFRAAQIACLSNDKDLQNHCLERLGFEGQDLLLRIQILSGLGRWEDLAELDSKVDLTSIPGPDSNIAWLMVKSAVVRRSEPDTRRTMLREMLLTYSGDDANLVVVALTAKSLGFHEIEDEAYQRAAVAILPESHISSRLNVAFMAEDRDDWSDVIELLDGYIDTQEDIPEVRMLARSFANVSPTLQRGLGFFDQLPSRIRTKSQYAHMESMTRFKAGDNEGALSCIKIAREQNPTDVSALLLNYGVLEQLHREEDARMLIQTVLPSNFVGSPLELMQLAHLMRRFRDATEAVDFGYRILERNPNNPDIELHFCGLIMGLPEGEVVPMTERSVKDGVWLRIKDEDGLIDDFVIDSKSETQFFKSVKPSDSRAAPFIGKELADKAIIERPLYGTRTWTIIEIKNLYLHALHEIMSTFNNRFPDHKGLQQFTIKGNDVQPILDIVKQKAERSQNVTQLYAENPLPVAMLASATGSSTIQLMEYLRSSNVGIKSCLGTLEERNNAFDIIEKGVDRGIVLDVTSAWTVLDLLALDVLKILFSSISITRSSLDEFEVVRREYQERLGRGGGMMTYHNGNFVLQEFDDAVTKQQIEGINDRIEQLEKNVSVVSATVPIGFNQSLLQLVSDPRRSHLLDSVFASSSLGMLLATEDVRYRQISMLANTPAVWLQEIFRFALHLGKIDSLRYAALILGLAQRRHNHLSLDLGTLVQVSTHYSADFGAAAEFIGTSDADIGSHISVVREFLNHFWLGVNTPPHAKASTGALLRSLIRFRPHDWSDCIALVTKNLSTNAVFQFYLRVWCIGHFLSYENIEGSWIRIKGL